MSRVTAGAHTRARHKKVLALAKGYHLGRKNLFRQARQAVIRAGVYSYRDRKVKKRVFRSGWIMALNAAARSRGLTYHELMSRLRGAHSPLDRKVLAELAKRDPAVFDTVVQNITPDNE